MTCLWLLMPVAAPAFFLALPIPIDPDALALVAAARCPLELVVGVSDLEAVSDRTDIESELFSLISTLRASSSWSAKCGEAGREAAEELHVVLALFLELIEGIFGVGIAIEVEIHLRVVGLELGTGLRHETIEAHAVAVAFGV